jgi:cytochrome c1
VNRRRIRCVGFALVVVALGGCDGGSRPPPAEGDAERGRALLHDLGCGACHSIPGVDAARGNVGPPLDNIGRRVYLAGTLANSPEQMARWIRSPQTIKPQTAMPNVGASEAQAKDMAAYLDRLR